jgi:ubiquitin C-terminal hydrolase
MGKKGKRHQKANTSTKGKYTPIDNDLIPLKKNTRNSNNELISSTNPTKGLQNIGNTCYFNSVIQAMNCTNSLNNYIDINTLPQNNEFYSNYNSKITNSFISILSSLRSEVTNRSNQTVNPLSLKENLSKVNHQFKGKHQQDSQELFVCLLSSIKEELEKYNKLIINEESDNNKNQISLSSKFEGICVSIVKCLTCEYQSYSYDDIFDISLEIPGSEHLMKYIPRPVAKVKGSLGSKSSIANALKKKSSKGDKSIQVPGVNEVVIDEVEGGKKDEKDEIVDKKDEIIDKKDEIVNGVIDLALKIDDIELVDTSSSSSSSSSNKDKHNDEIFIKDVSENAIIGKTIIEGEESVEDAIKWAQEMLSSKQNNNENEILEPINIENNDIEYNNINTSTAKVDINTCLDAFTRNERIEVAKSNGYKCPSCSVKTGKYDLIFSLLYHY